MSRALRKPPPRRLTRMEAEAGEKPFDDPDWLFEPAFPGRRVLARVEGEQVRLLAGAEDLAGGCRRSPRPWLPCARARRCWTAWWWRWTRGPSSEEALALELAQGGAGAVLYLFDLLYAEDWDLRGLPCGSARRPARLLPDSGASRSSSRWPSADWPWRALPASRVCRPSWPSGGQRIPGGAAKDWLRIR